MRFIQYGFVLVFCMALSLSLLDDQILRMALLDEQRPFIYRAFIYRLAFLLAIITNTNLFLVTRLLATLCYVIGYWAFEQLAKDVLWHIPPQKMVFAWTLPLLPMLMLAHHAYDSVTVATWGLAALMLHRRNWTGYWLAFILATINRETTIFLVALFAIQQWRQPRYYRRLIIQLMIFALLRLTIAYLFRHAPGGFTENHFSGYYVAFFNAPLLFLIVYGGLAAITIRIAFRLHLFPPIIKQGLLVIALPLALLIIPFGHPYEFRPLLESYPFLIMAIFGQFPNEANVSTS